MIYRNNDAITAAIANLEYDFMMREYDKNEARAAGRILEQQLDGLEAAIKMLTARHQMLEHEYFVRGFEVTEAEGAMRAIEHQLGELAIERVV